MPREIRFRAWGHQETEPYKMFTEDISFDHYMVPYFDNIPICDHDLMQFTGMQDKHGQDIYESDLVDYLNGTIKDPDGDGYIPNINQYVVKCEKVLSCNIAQFRHCQSNLVIVGNIYEPTEKEDEGQS